MAVLAWLVDIQRMVYPHKWVKHRTGKVRRPKNGVLPLCHATNHQCQSTEENKIANPNKWLGTVFPSSTMGFLMEWVLLCLCQLTDANTKSPMPVQVDLYNGCKTAVYPSISLEYKQTSGLSGQRPVTPRACGALLLIMPAALVKKHPVVQFTIS